MSDNLTCWLCGKHIEKEEDIYEFLPKEGEEKQHWHKECVEKTGVYKDNILNKDKTNSNLTKIADLESNKKRNKYFTFSAIGIVLVLIIFSVMVYNTNKKSEDYHNLISLTELSIVAASAKAVDVCSEYNDVWSGAINRGGSFNYAISSKKDELESNGTTKSIEETKKGIDSMMKKLNSPPREYEKAYSKLMELYGTYCEIESQAVSPSGSLVSFTSNINSLQSKLLREANEFDVLVPQADKK